MPQRTLSEPEFNDIKAKVLASLPAGLTEEEFHRVAAPAMAQAIGEAESRPPTPEGSGIGRFVSNAASMLNPVAAAEGLYNAVRHPVDTVSNIGSAMLDQGRQAVQGLQNAHSAGDVSAAIGHGAAAFLPIVGPAAANAGEQIGQGDVAGGLGTAAGLLAPMGVAPAVRGARAALSPATREAAAVGLERGAAARVADVMAPKVGANKVRFGNMAEQVAPSLAKMPDGASWSREGLHAQVGARLEQAEAALDETANARLGARTFPTQPIIADLMAKRARLTAQAVEGSRLTPEYQGAGVRGARVTGDPATTELGAGPDVSPADLPRHEHGYRSTDDGTFAKEPTRASRPIGKDVEPSPNAARIRAIDKAIAEVRQLGPVARYEPLRRIREAWDGPAKVKYNPSMTADFLKNQGFANGAADVTGTLREHLAKFDPETHSANAEYSLYRKADDVLTATAEIERTRPKVGRQIMARLTGTLAGQQAAGVPGAIGGFVLGPALDAAVSSGVTTKLQTARVMTKLAEAIRKGDIGHVASLSYDLKRMGVQAAAVQQATTANSRQMQPAGASQ